MPVIDTIEKKYLFSLTRFVALFFIVLAVLPIVFGLFHYGRQAVPQSVSIDKNDIAEIIKPHSNPETGAEGYSEESYSGGGSNGFDPLAGKKLPFSIQKHFSRPDDMDVLKGWMRTMSDGERDVFLTELDIVAQQAELRKIDITDAMNRFWNVKSQKFDSRIQEELALKARNYVIASVIGGCILTIAIFSLVLVLLAIERNTRKMAA